MMRVAHKQHHWIADHSPVIRNFIGLCDEAVQRLDMRFECNG